MAPGSGSQTPGRTALTDDLKGTPGKMLKHHFLQDVLGPNYTFLSRLVVAVPIPYLACGSVLIARSGFFVGPMAGPADCRIVPCSFEAMPALEVFVCACNLYMIDF